MTEAVGTIRQIRDESGGDVASKIVVEVVVDVPLETWIESARKGSTDALGWAFEACRPALVRKAKDLLPADLRVKEDVTDVVQQTFLEAYRDFGHFNGRNGQELASWLRTILINNMHKVVRHYRHAEKREIRREVPMSWLAPDASCPYEFMDDTTSPSGRAMRKERIEAIWRAIARLPEQDRNVLMLRSQNELTFDEIGREFGCSAVTARNRWLSAIRRLWTELGVSSLMR